jgi:dCMP deaminase
MDWHNYFFNLIDVIKTKSKDKHTQIGCVIVGPAHEIRSTGYNSFPRGINDNVSERYERPYKYLWFEHSERNAIYNAARCGTPLEGCTIYLRVLPCTDCARAIIQCGIKTLVYDKKAWEEWSKGSGSQWVKDIQISLDMMNEAGIEIVAI